MQEKATRPARLAEEGFAIIPRFVLLHPDLTYAEKILYGRLLPLMQNERGYCWADNGQIAEASGVKHRTVERGVPKLAELGLVRITGAQNQSRRIYPGPAYEDAALPLKRRSPVPQNGAAAPAERRSNSREEENNEEMGNTAAEKARVAERVLEYHEGLRALAIGGRFRPIGAKARVKVLQMLGAILSDDTWTEARLRAVVRGHLREGSWWREQRHTHPRYAFRDVVNAERMEEEGEEAGGSEEAGGEWPSVSEEEGEFEGEWEGLPDDEAADA